MEEQRARSILAFSTSEGWGLLVEHVNHELDRARADLKNPDNSRDKDLFIKGSIYTMEAILELPRKADRLLKSLTQPPEEG